MVRRRWARWWMALVAAGVLAAGCGSDGDGGAASTTSAKPATTATAPTTTAPTTTPAVDTTTAVFPSGANPPVFEDPVAAAKAFAVDFVGFVDPVVGEFRQGDSRSGEVEVRPTTDGPVTTVLVRLLGDTWWVLGSGTANIDIGDPEALASVSSPLHLAGVSTAFEANVGVQVREDGARQPIGTGFVMGGSMGEMGSFDGSVTFRRPTAPMGALVLDTVSMKDGNVWEASVLRIRFAP